MDGEWCLNHGVVAEVGGWAVGVKGGNGPGFGVEDVFYGVEEVSRGHDVDIDCVSGAGDIIDVFPGALDAVAGVDFPDPCHDILVGIETVEDVVSDLLDVAGLAKCGREDCAC